jgi:very-short-patch-repair endonuclease
MPKRIRGSPADATELARGLRRRSTEAEQLLWEALRGRKLDGVKFRRQHQLGHFIVDFWCPAYRLVIEIDGAIHDHLVEHDAERTAEIESRGCRVIRFRNDDVLTNLENVLQRIRAAVQTSPRSQNRESDQG